MYIYIYIYKNIYIYIYISTRYYATKNNRPNSSKSEIDFIPSSRDSFPLSFYPVSIISQSFSPSYFEKCSFVIFLPKHSSCIYPSYWHPNGSKSGSRSRHLWPL